MAVPSSASRSARHPTLTFSISVTPIGTSYEKNPLNLNKEHRRLDRSASEPLAQQQQQKPAATINQSSRYKTEMCRPFEENGDCKYGDKCQFAHGFGELRNLARHPKYKTELCRTFHSSGFCPYGPRCHFIHNDFTRNPIGGFQPSGNINIDSNNIESLLESTGGSRGISFSDITLNNFSPGSAGDISPNSSSMSASPTSCNGFIIGDEVRASSPVPQGVPSVSSNSFFSPDFVRIPSTHRQFSPAFIQQVLALRHTKPPPRSHPSVESLQEAITELSFRSNRRNSNPSRPASLSDDTSNIRLPIFNQLAFPPDPPNRSRH